MELALESSSTIVMKELSDIKEKLAVNTTKTVVIESMVYGIQTDLKIFQSSFATNEDLKSLVTDINDHETRLRAVESNVWRAIGALAVCQIIIIPIVLYIIYNNL